MAKHNLYDETPEMKRDEEGKMNVKKKEKAHKEGEEHKSDTSAGLEVHGESAMRARHGLDRHMMHAKHEHEHAMHKEGDKKEIHSRHEKEMKDIHTRHEKEAGATAGSKDVGESIAKIEKGAK